MTFVAAKCPQCAGSLQVPSDRDIVKCMYCGIDVVVRQAIQLVSGNSKNFLELAKTASAAGNYSEANAYFTKTIEIEPTNAEAWFGKGTSAGWLSSLNEFRFGEMLVAYENAIKFSKAESIGEMKIACADTLNAVATACYMMSRKHALQFIAVPNIWGEYLERCRQIIALYQIAHSHSPGDRTAIENVIHMCKDNLEGVTYKSPHHRIMYNFVRISDEYEKEIRRTLTVYSEEMRKLEPNYVAPKPKSPPPCYVITATLGYESHPYVLLLRSFRDDFLVKSATGTALVTWYYKHGPAVARRIENSKFARIMSYVFVVVPGVGIAKVVMWLWRQSRRS
jgi:tetratricopeptide (TPR) repeat protein